MSSAATAQAPRITAAGDPSIVPDSIYALAVDPADYPDDDDVVLLDDGVVRYEADGSGTATYRMVVQLLKRDAVDTWAERTLSWDVDRERLHLNWAHVVGTDGHVISSQPLHAQEMDAPVPEQSPVYTHRKRLRVSLAGVAPGAIVDLSYTRETVKPVLARDFYDSWSINQGRAVRRSRYILDVPAGFEPRIHQANLTTAPRVVEANGRRTTTWEYRDLAKVEGEPFAADSNAVTQWLLVSGPVEWSDIARWYAGLAADRYALTPALKAQLASLVAGAKSRDDSLRAVQRWVATDIRYVSLSLGIGGYQPRPPAAVLETRSGDCKDKATLFIALARAMGIHALPVLVSTGADLRLDQPSVSAFDHMIAALPSRDGYRFVDLTADLVPFGEIPPNLEGQHGLLIHDDGTGEVVGLPRHGAEVNHTTSRVVGQLGEDGSFQGRYTEEEAGALQYTLRAAFADPLTGEQRDQLGRAVANGVFEGAVADSMHAFEGRDPLATPRFTLWMHAASALTGAGSTRILTLPLQSYASPTLIAQLQAKPRRFTIDAGTVIGAEAHLNELVLTLPKGWHAQLPPAVHARSAFGTYDAEYAQNGRELHVTRRISGARGVLPPERLNELVTWLQQITTDNVRYIELRTSH